ncbi:MAG: hypothetical protein K9M07_05400 [Simkaniaceae bacterium]|nr:hypothetical protein [Simkaniaceae bacterium]MCF7852655.1 hypothetical protein [Simkaniaceae bacterium]
MRYLIYSIVVLNCSLIIGAEYTIKPFPEYSKQGFIALESSEKQDYESAGYHEAQPNEERDAPVVEFFGGGIYWKARTTDSMYAVRASSDAFALPYRSSLSEVDFNFDWGVRFGAGWFTGYDQWGLSATYTYLNTDKTDRTRAGMWGDLKSPVGFSQSMTDLLLDGTELSQVVFQRASSQYDLGYQTIDVLISRPFQASSIQFAPQIGLEGAILHSKQNIYYSGGQLLENNTLTVRKNNRYWGVGPKTGIAMGWGLKRGFTLIQNFAFALLIGDLNSYYGEDLSNSTSDWMKLEESDKRFVPHAAAQMGLGYQAKFDKMMKQVNAQLLFEGHFLWNFIQKVIAGDDFDFGNLYLYGLTFELGVDF